MTADLDLSPEAVARLAKVCCETGSNYMTATQTPKVMLALSGRHEADQTEIDKLRSALQKIIRINERQQDGVLYPNDAVGWMMALDDTLSEASDALSALSTEIAAEADEIARLKADNERLRAAAQLGLDMAMANDLWNTADTIRAALATNIRRLV